MDVRTPLCFAHPDKPGRMVFMDMFVTRGAKNDNLSLYCVSTYYGVDDVSLADVTVWVNGQVVSGAEHGTNSREPIRCWEFGLNDSASTFAVCVQYHEARHEYDLEVVTPAHQPLAVCTLFKDDYDAIALFHAYYRAQGVTRFYLYYNGEALPADIFQSPDIEYTTWPYRYWNNAPGEHVHHAQMAQLCSMQYRYLPYCGHLISCDLDEFISHPSMRLAEWLETMGCVEFVIVPNVWGQIVAKYDDTLTLSVSTEPICFHQRAKPIYTPAFRGTVNIHRPRNTNPSYAATDVSMLHVVDIGHPERADLIQNPRNVVLRLI